PLCSGALIEIARVLMQERGQNSVGKQAFGDAAGEVSTEPLAISLCILGPIGGVRGLIDAGPCSLQTEESWMGETFVREMELHLGGKRLGVRVINHIYVRYKSKNTLLFLGFDLLGSNLFRGVIHGNCPLHSQNAKFDVGYSFLLPRLDCNGRAPLCKSFRGDGDVISNARRGLVECEASIVLCYNRKTIAGRPLKDYGGTGNWIVAGIHNRAKDASCFCICRYSRLRGRGYNKEQSSQ